MLTRIDQIKKTVHDYVNSLKQPSPEKEQDLRCFEVGVIGGLFVAVIWLARAKSIPADIDGRTHIAAVCGAFGIVVGIALVLVTRALSGRCP